MVTTNLNVAQILDANGRVLHEAPTLMMRQQVNGTGLPEYVGLAIPGSAGSGSVWQIRKYTYSGNYLVKVEFADGNNQFDNIWNNRTSLSYS